MPNNTFVFEAGVCRTEKNELIRQLSAALAKGSEMTGRTKHPKWWKLRDRLSKRFPGAGRDKSAHFRPMAANLVEIRNTRREADEVVFDSRGMTMASGEEVPFRSFHIFAETESLYLFGWDERLMFLEKSSLREGNCADFAQFFSKRTSLECFKA